MIPISLRLILILSSHLRLGHSKRPVKIFKGLIFSHSGYMTCPSQSSRLNHPDYIRWTIEFMNLSIRICLWTSTVFKILLKSLDIFMHHSIGRYHKLTKNFPPSWSSVSYIISRSMHLRIIKYCQNVTLTKDTVRKALLCPTLYNSVALPNEELPEALSSVMIQFFPLLLGSWGESDLRRAWPAPGRCCSSDLSCPDKTNTGIEKDCRGPQTHLYTSPHSFRQTNQFSSHARPP